jgi:hypothetical protein
MAGAAAIIGLAAPVAHADDITQLLDLSANGVPVRVGPDPLLESAITDFNNANQVLNEVPAIGTADETALVNQQLDVQFDLTGLPLPGTTGVGGQLAELQTAENIISSYDNGALASDVSPFFTNLNQDWYTASESLLTADQAFETAAATGTSPIPAELAIYGADLSLLNDAANSAAVDWTSSLFGDSSATAGAADAASTVALAASSGNQYDPAVFAYSSDPTNVFSPVYSIQPVGPEDVTVTDASGDVFGTQDFSISTFGIPVDTFTGNVEYSATSSPLDLFGNPYVEDINVAGIPGTLLPENTGFLVTEFGSGYGNVLEESMNAAGTSATVGDFILTPFGDENITPIVDFLLNYTGGPLTDAAGAVDPSSFADLLSSIGL